jgi:HAD superfamily hydrolase (TIGR01509 family)
MKKAVIFDMDGVISDTQKFHAQVWSKVMGKYGINISPEDATFKYAGQTTREIFKLLLEQAGLAEFLDKAVEEKEIMIQEPQYQLIAPIKGSVSLIKKLFKDGRDIALATGSERSRAERVLDQLKLRGYFKAIVTSDDVSRTKPDPEVYLKAAHKLGRDTAECVVVEDAPNGMLAGRLAGMSVIGLVLENLDRTKYPADHFVSSLDELTLADF